MKLVRSGFFAALVAVVFASTAGTAGASALVDDQDLGELSLDQLMGITITSASKKAQSADEVSSAIFVLTNDDIRRSGATSIPEVLRLVPGLQVSRINSNSWSVTSRGFSGRFASKLLVLIDGRSVYTPLFSGVYWDVQDTLLEDIDRIEVIRGPGATVWGANAVNGVINIITKEAKDTQGLLATVGGGNEDRIMGGLRFGGSVGENLNYRVYGKYDDRDAFQTATGAKDRDDWDIARGGFRMEWTPTESDKLTLQGDGYDGDAGMSFTGLTGLSPTLRTFNSDQQIHGWNALGRWSHTFSETQDASVQIYYDRTDRAAPLIKEIRHTYDFEFQHRFALPFNQEVIWGGGYRYTEDRIENTFSTGMVPTRRHDDTFSMFVQDEIRFVEEKMRLTFGTKIENNDYTGWEYQPSVRLTAMPHENHTFWSSVSRAVRVPSRADDNALLRLAFVPALPPGATNPLTGTACPLLPFGGCPQTLVQAIGSGTRGSRSERLYAFEAGWRGQFLERFTADVSAFFNDFDFLTSFDTGPTTVSFVPAPLVTQSAVLGSSEKRQNWGVEVDLRAQITDWWRIIVGYTYLKSHEESLDASHQGVFRSQIDLPFNLEFDTILYVIGNLHSHSAPGLSISPAVDIPSYERLDLRLGWKPNENLEFSLVGQNLLEGRHTEYVSELGIAASEVQRAYYGKITYRY